MNFLWPLALLGAAVLPLLIAAYAWSLRRRPRTAIRYSSLSLIRDARPGSSRIRRHLPFALFVVAIGALVLALGRPAVVLAVPTNQTTIILAIDVSGSMCSADIPPSRLQAAEAAAASFIEHQSASAQIGIVAFSGFAEVVQSPTTDQQSLLRALGSPDHRAADRHRQRDPLVDRRHRPGRQFRGAEPVRHHAGHGAGARFRRAPMPRTSSCCSRTG